MLTLRSALAIGRAWAPPAVEWLCSLPTGKYGGSRLESCRQAHRFKLGNTGEALAEVGEDA